MGEKEREENMYKIYEKVIILYNKSMPNKTAIIMDEKDRRKEIEDYPDRYETDNKDFIVSGPLWFQKNSTYCNIEKNGMKWEVCFNIYFFFKTLKESTVVDGVFQEKMLLYSNQGRLGFMHKHMKEYQAAEADMEKRNEYRKATKTKKRIPGCRYFSLQDDFIHLGEVYNWSRQRNFYILDPNRKKYSCYYFTNIPEKVDIFINTKDVPSGVKRVSEVLETLSPLFDFGFADNDKLQTFYRNINHKAPSRAKGQQLLENDLTEEKLEEILEHSRKKLNDMITECQKKKDGSELGDIYRDLFIKSIVLWGTASDDIPHDFTLQQKIFFDIAKVNPVLTCKI